MLYVTQEKYLALIGSCVDETLSAGTAEMHPLDLQAAVELANNVVYVILRDLEKE